MKVIIAGSRTIKDRDLVFETIRNVVEKENLEITEVVSGTLEGPDTFGAEWALERGIKVKGFKPKYDLAGGPEYYRNEAMAKYADALIIVLDGEDLVSRHLMIEAEKNGLKVFVRRVY